MVKDKQLLDEFRYAYECYAKGDNEEFDRTLERVVLAFGGNLKRIMKRLYKETGNG